MTRYVPGAFGVNVPDVAVPPAPTGRPFEVANGVPVQVTSPGP
jgi:hypothetical protein